MNTLFISKKPIKRGRFNGVIDSQMNHADIACLYEIKILVALNLFGSPTG